MADIDIERKKKSPLPWVLALLVLALLAFLLMRSCGDDDAAPVTDTTTAPAATAAGAAPMPATDTTGMAATGAAGAAGAAGAGWIGTVLAGTNAGQTTGGSGIVPETPSDRGFWIEENGQRVFAILAEPMEQVKDIDPGQRVTLSNARVMRGSEASQVPQDVDAEARQTAQGQPYFLLVPASGVQIVAGGNTTPD
ncbi:hypothetical protein [Longimicrobium sp.]|uniref:hypothetical protein n=1 Tax=Longimicrobium sp. TaxID=2029185 RepID=UPI002E3503CE|nr:hypothetical protein [Longimicrobium sp.]HEX6039295.1 hypothetical protein [Longimicrobium sp.]